MEEVRERFTDADRPTTYAGLLFRLPMRVLYALIGAFLSLGAPAGLFLLRYVQSGAPSWLWIRAELAGALSIYLYVTVSTSIVFTLFGYVLGRQADRLVELSRRDPLTGLENSRVFGERLHEEYARAHRYGTPLSLLLVDLDGLKEINDRHGHRAGDAALRRVAEAIRSALRSTDHGARWGGDEFALLAPNTPETAASALGERVRALVATEREDGQRLSVTASVGVATLDPTSPYLDAQALMAVADTALYQAKMRGRNRVVVGHAANRQPRATA